MVVVGKGSGGVDVGVVCGLRGGEASARRFAVENTGEADCGRRKARRGVAHFHPPSVRGDAVGFQRCGVYARRLERQGGESGADGQVRHHLNRGTRQHGGAAGGGLSVRALGGAGPGLDEISRRNVRLKNNLVADNRLAAAGDLDIPQQGAHGGIRGRGGAQRQLRGGKCIPHFALAPRQGKSGADGNVFARGDNAFGGLPQAHAVQNFPVGFAVAAPSGDEISGVRAGGESHKDFRRDISAGLQRTSIRGGGKRSVLRLFEIDGEARHRLQNDGGGHAGGDSNRRPGRDGDGQSLMRACECVQADGGMQRAGSGFAGKRMRDLFGADFQPRVGPLDGEGQRDGGQSGQSEPFAAGDVHRNGHRVAGTADGGGGSGDVHVRARQAVWFAVVVRRGQNAQRAQCVAGGGHLQVFAVGESGGQQLIIVRLRGLSVYVGEESG